MTILTVQVAIFWLFGCWLRPSQGSAQTVKIGNSKTTTAAKKDFVVDPVIAAIRLQWIFTLKDFNVKTKFVTIDKIVQSIIRFIAKINRSAPILAISMYRKNGR